VTIYCYSTVQINVVVVVTNVTGQLRRGGGEGGAEQNSDLFNNKWVLRQVAVNSEVVILTR